MKFIRTISILAVGAAVAACASAKALPEKKPAPSEAAVQSYILLDRSGSMSTLWEEALGSVNAYAESVDKDAEGKAGDDLKARVTLAVFDHHNGLQFDVLRDKVESGDWKKVTDEEAGPRGMTPLFDAIGRIMTRAEADNPEKAVIVVMTDGLENASKEFTKEGVKAALDRAEKRGWEVVFLGAEFATFSDADAVGVSASRQMAIGQGRMKESMDSLGQKARSYGKGEASSIEFSDEDRAVAGEQEVIDRKGGSNVTSPRSQQPRN